MLRLVTISLFLSLSLVAEVLPGSSPVRNGQSGFKGAIVATPAMTRMSDVRRFDTLFDEYPTAPVEVATLTNTYKERNVWKSERFCVISMPTLHKELRLTPEEARYFSGLLEHDLYNVTIYTKLWFRGQKGP